MRLLKEETTGLVIDIQERLFPHISENEVMLQNCIKLIEGLKVLDIPVFVTEQYKKGLGETLPQVTSLFEKFEGIEKLAFSCADEPRYFEKLELTKRCNVIICGMETHVCILQTSLDLLGQGYMPVVVEDAVSSRKLSDKTTALARIRQEGGIITSTESVLFELTRAAGSDTFKAISKLVK
jgi:nicotinamidase-related amidase